MRRILPVVALIVSSGCGGGGGSTASVSVAVVSLNLTAVTMTVGQTTTLTATLTDSKGAVLTGRAVTWTSSNPAAASVAGGVVTALAVGTTTITATSEGKSGLSQITVTAPAASCGSTSPSNLQVGEIHTLSSAERQILCLPGGASGTEYALIALNTAQAPTSIPFEAIGANTSASTGAPLAQLNLAMDGSLTQPARILSQDTPHRDLAFEHRLRAFERATLGPLRRAYATRQRNRQAPPAFGGAAIRGLAPIPNVGDLVTLNTNSLSNCTSVQNRTGRVAAVSANAIAVVDTGAPTGGFSDAEFLGIATSFDTLVYPLDTLNFGAPSRYWDANGRVLMFFTVAVNQLSRNSDNSYIGGFFFERDILPDSLWPGGTCPGSNHGDMFYLPVPDPGQRYNRYFTNKNAMLTGILGTTVHEFQHLINASRRIFVTPEIVDDEEVWLNEGMSHFAEELLWYRVSGTAPKQDLNFAVATTPATRLDALNAYQTENLARFSDYITAPNLNSPFADNDDLETRGATWALLRWCVDQLPNASRTYTKALVDAPTQGIPNFNNVFAGVGGLAGAVRSQVITNFTDNTTIGVPALYTYPSWNYREFLTHFAFNGGRYPLATRTLTSSKTTYSLQGGSAGYLRFRVNAGATGVVTPTSNNSTVNSSLELILIRTQ